MWANWEILSVAAIDIKIWVPRYITRIRMKVSGISPWLKFVNDASRISIKTTPDAPRSIVGKKIALRMPVTPAVTSIMHNRANEPCFFSSIGPTRSMIEKFAKRWFQSACPAIWEKTETQQFKLAGENCPLPLAVNQSGVREGIDVFVSAITRTQKNAKVRITGELYLTLKSCFPS
jgi:hypothetical protein